ncbi:hypothetical protein EQU24_09220 [Methylotuvimicrobium buryatense]|uniref:Uncharacterized protein n=1 Tax=Methylotuvimicrobium buryatense TaxID=95641 RepID=A0A4P9UPF8_METBY|nr:hypothetical protein EQU24_09220 [Methylotuvimicrobium buryatense]
MSAAGQIFAPAKSAFTPSLAFERCRQAPMDGFTAVLDRHIPCLLFLDGFSIIREYDFFMQFDGLIFYFLSGR